MDFDKFLNLPLDYPGIEIGYELWAIESVVQVVDEHYPEMRDQYKLRAGHAAWASQELDGDERKRKLQSIEEITEKILPRFYRSPSVMSIWALFELSVNEIADYLKKTEDKILCISDIKARNFRDRFNKYFNGVLGIVVEVSEKDWGELTDLQKFRNLIAHANGRIDAGTPEKKDKHKKLVAKTDGVIVERNRMVFDQVFVVKKMRLVRRILSTIDLVVAERYNWSPLIANEH